MGHTIVKIYAGNGISGAKGTTSGRIGSTVTPPAVDLTW
jgi:hypothetical protein